MKKIIALGILLIAGIKMMSQTYNPDKAAEYAREWCDLDENATCLYSAHTNFRCDSDLSDYGPNNTLFFFHIKSSIPEHCDNCLQDGDGTGVDCGGSCPPCEHAPDNRTIGGVYGWDILNAARVSVRIYQANKSYHHVECHRGTVYPSQEGRVVLWDTGVHPHQHHRDGQPVGGGAPWLERGDKRETFLPYFHRRGVWQLG